MPCWQVNRIKVQERLKVGDKQLLSDAIMGLAKEGLDVQVSGNDLIVNRKRKYSEGRDTLRMDLNTLEMTFDKGMTDVVDLIKRKYSEAGLKKLRTTMVKRGWKAQLLGARKMVLKVGR